MQPNLPTDQPQGQPDIADLLRELADWHKKLHRETCSFMSLNGRLTVFKQSGGKADSLPILEFSAAPLVGSEAVRCAVDLRDVAADNPNHVDYVLVPLAKAAGANALEAVAEMVSRVNLLHDMMTAMLAPPPAAQPPRATPATPTETQFRA